MYRTFSWRPGRIMLSQLCRLGALVMALGGCSVLVMRGVDPQQVHEQEPICSETMTPVLFDGVAASTIAGILAETIRDDASDGTRMVAMVVSSLALTLSAKVGADRYKECRLARASWHTREALREGDVTAGQAAATAAGLPAVAATELPPPPAAEHQGAVPTRRGYFCTRSIPRSAGDLCVREREVCERARRALGIPDHEPCTSHEVLWCFTSGARRRCFGTARGCASVLVKSPSVTAPCTERP